MRLGVFGKNRLRPRPILTPSSQITKSWCHFAPTEAALPTYVPIISRKVSEDWAKEVGFGEQKAFSRELKWDIFDIFNKVEIENRSSFVQDSTRVQLDHRR